MYLQMITCSSI